MKYPHPHFIEEETEIQESYNPDPIAIEIHELFPTD